MKSVGTIISQNVNYNGKMINCVDINHNSAIHSQHVLSVFLLSRKTSGNKILGLHTWLLLNVILPPSSNQIKFRSRGEEDLMLQRLPARREKRCRLRLPPHSAPSPSPRPGPNPLSWLFLSLQPFLYSIIKTHRTTCCLFH